MNEKNNLDTRKTYLKEFPKLFKYLKNKNIPDIFTRKKSTLFATGGIDKKIDLFTNSLEYMGKLMGHKEKIRCLCGLSKREIASGSEDKTIKIWEVRRKVIISSLSLHSAGVSALCHPRPNILVSGSCDKSLAIWKLGDSSPPIILTGHTSEIQGIISLLEGEIISGEYGGDLRIWNVEEGTCRKHIQKPSKFDPLCQMKEYPGCRWDVACCMWNKVELWGRANNWEGPLQVDELNIGCSVEYISPSLFLRGGRWGRLDILLGTSVQGFALHSLAINDILHIAKNIVVTVSNDKTVKVIHITQPKCFLNFTDNTDRVLAIAKFN